MRIGDNSARYFDEYQLVGVDLNRIVVKKQQVRRREDIAGERRVLATADGGIQVVDDGRGIPVDIHKQTKKSALETVLRRALKNQVN